MLTIRKSMPRSHSLQSHDPKCARIPGADRIVLLLSVYASGLGLVKSSHRNVPALHIPKPVGAAVSWFGSIH